MVAEGKTNREIGAALFISESTAGVHVSNILGKLGVSSRTEAAAYAFRVGLVEPTPALDETASAYEEPAADVLALPHPAGWWARLKAQASRHPRSTIVAGGSVVVLTAIMTALAVAVLGETARAASARPVLRQPHWRGDQRAAHHCRRPRAPHPHPGRRPQRRAPRRRPAVIAIRRSFGDGGADSNSCDRISPSADAVAGRQMDGRWRHDRRPNVAGGHAPGRRIRPGHRRRAGLRYRP